MAELQRSEVEAAFRGALDRALADHVFSEIAVDEVAREKLTRFAVDLIEANRQFNLTAIADPEEAAVKHVADSLTAFLVGRWPEGAAVCDIGTGAGLPGIVLAVARPDLDIHLVDSVQKKLKFASEAARALGLKISTIHARAESLGQDPKYREGFDVVIARAVAKMPVLSEYCLPLVRVGGCFVAMKGPKARQELNEASRAMAKLGGSDPKVREFALPGDAGQRTLISVEKSKETPKAYPRKPGLPAKRPLV